MRCVVELLSPHAEKSEKGEDFHLGSGTITQSAGLSGMTADGNGNNSEILIVEQWVSVINAAVEDVSLRSFSIDLSQRSLDLKEIRALCVTLENNKDVVKRLMLRNCDLDSSCLIYIVRLIRKNASVQYLDISNNHKSI